MNNNTSKDQSQPLFKKFRAEYAKSDYSNCKFCLKKIQKNALRIAKIAYNPKTRGPMLLWHHPRCIFQAFKKQRATTVKIESPWDIEGWNNLEYKDQKTILSSLPKLNPEKYLASKKNCLDDICSTKEKETKTTKIGNSSNKIDNQSCLFSENIKLSYPEEHLKETNSNVTTPQADYENLHREDFAAFLTRELESLTDNKIYRRVKGELICLIRAAQSEQIKYEMK